MMATTGRKRRIPACFPTRVEIGWKDALKARVWLEVRPDDYYHTDVYTLFLKDLPRNGQAARLISKADATAISSAYRVFETVV